MIYITALLQVGRSQQVAERRLQELQVLKENKFDQFNV